MEANLTEECRVAIVEPSTRKLVAIMPLTQLTLPRVVVPLYVRHAEAATRLLAQEFGLCTIQLALLPDEHGRMSCAIHELLSPPALLPRHASLITLKELPSEELSDRERNLVLRFQEGKESHFGRFAQVGWLEALITTLGFPRDRAKMPRIRQLNQSIDFCLLSLTTDANRTFWFKAVGDPNKNEFVFTAELARRFPAYLPKIVHTLPEWNAWVTSNVDGAPLNSSFDMALHRRALEALAVMQKGLANEIELFVAMGARRWTVEEFEQLLPPFLEEMEVAMRSQISKTSSALSRDELRSLGTQLRWMLAEIKGLQIAPTLVHGDIGHGNILVSKTETIFLDWAETYAGNPFVCAEHLLADLERSACCPQGSLQGLRRFYGHQWNEALCAEARAYLSDFGATFGALACALMTWHANKSRNTGSVAWPFLRSMTRRTRRELVSAVGARA
jgi:hypothetical protein